MKRCLKTSFSTATSVKTADLAFRQSSAFLASPLIPPPQNGMFLPVPQ